MIHVQQVTAAGDSRTIALVYDVPPRGVARLIDVAERTPRKIDGTLPPLTLETAQVDELLQLRAILPQLGTSQPTHSQVCHTTHTTSRVPRALTLLWALPAGYIEPAADTRWTTLADLFAHGGQLVGVLAGRHKGLPLQKLAGRRIVAPVYHALMLVAPQITDPRLVRRLLRQAETEAASPGPLPAAA